MINTQIASYLAPGSVTWLFYADRLMEFPGLAGVAWAWCSPPAHCRQSGGDAQKYSGHAGLGFAHRGAAGRALRRGVAHLCQTLVATLFHYGKLAGRCGADCRGVGWLWGGLAGPGGHQGAGARLLRQPGCAPVKIAIVVLVITQILNAVLVPLIDHAGWPCRLAWGSGQRAVAVDRAGAARQLPAPAGLVALCPQVVAASALLAVLLAWGSHYFDWVALRAHSGQRVLLLLGLMMAAAWYFGALGPQGSSCGRCCAAERSLRTRRSGGNTG